jgi:hypothetical protein
VGMWRSMAEQLSEPETPDEDLPQDPGTPGGQSAPETERDGGMQDPNSPADPHGIDAPDSPSTPPPVH